MSNLQKTLSVVLVILMMAALIPGSAFATQDNLLTFSEEDMASPAEFADGAPWSQDILDGTHIGFYGWAWDEGGVRPTNREMFTYSTSAAAGTVKDGYKALAMDFSKAAYSDIYYRCATTKIIFTKRITPSAQSRTYTLFFWVKGVPGATQTSIATNDISVQAKVNSSAVIFPDQFSDTYIVPQFLGGDEWFYFTSAAAAQPVLGNGNPSAINSVFAASNWVLFARTFTVAPLDVIGRYNDVISVEIAFYQPAMGGRFDATYYVDKIGLVEGSTVPLWVDDCQVQSVNNITVFVKDANAISNYLIDGMFRLNVGDQIPLDTYVTLTNGVEEPTAVSWASSNPYVAEVINGKLVGKAEGTATISAIKDFASSSFNVYVEQPRPNILSYTDENVFGVSASSPWDRKMLDGSGQITYWFWDADGRPTNGEMLYLTSSPGDVKAGSKSVVMDFSKANPPVDLITVPSPVGKLMLANKMSTSDLPRTFTFYFWVKMKPGILQDISKISADNLNVYAYTNNSAIAVPAEFDNPSYRQSLITGDFKDSLYTDPQAGTPITFSEANTRLRNGEWLLFKKTFTMPAKENVPGGRYNDNLCFEISLQGSNHIDGAYYFDGFGLVEGSVVPKSADGKVAPPFASPAKFTYNATGYGIYEDEQIGLNDYDKGTPRAVTISPASGWYISDLKARVISNPLGLTVSAIQNNTLTFTLPPDASTWYNENETVIRITGKIDGAQFVRNLYIGYELPTQLTLSNGTPVGGLNVEYFKPVNLKLTATVGQYPTNLQVVPSDREKADIDVRLIDGQTIFRLKAMRNPASMESAVLEKIVTLANGKRQIKRQSFTTSRAYVYNDGTRDRYGLYVQSGKLMRNGAEYKAMGVNYFTAAYYALEALSRNDSAGVAYELNVTAENLKLLKDYGTPVIRIAFSGFGPGEIRSFFDPAKHDQYIAILDSVVTECERNGIGIIPSMFWCYNMVPDLVGEHLVAALGRAGSNTWHYMSRYISEIVNRYKYSPAIWAWEFGNETNLWFDDPGVGSPAVYTGPMMPANTPYQTGAPSLPPYTQISGRVNTKTGVNSDILMMKEVLPKSGPTYGNWVYMFNRFASEVNAADPSGRLLSTGNGFPRYGAYLAAYNEQGGNDNLTQFKTIFKDQNPGAINSLGGHMYRSDQGRTAWIPTSTYNTEAKRFDRFVSQIMAAASEAGKIVIIGEFGCSDIIMDNSLGQPLPSSQWYYSPSEAQAVFQTMVNTIQTRNVPLSLIWNFGTRGDTSWDVSPNICPSRTYQLEAMRDLNTMWGVQ